MAEKLKPYGFIRIHGSVVVNISAVEEIQSLPTGESRLRVKGGKEYLVTRAYKDSLRDLAPGEWAQSGFVANRSKVVSKARRWSEQILHAIPGNLEEGRGSQEDSLLRGGQPAVALPPDP